MTDVTGALLSRQVRREIERKKSKNAVLTVKPDYLKDLCSQAVAKEAAKLAADAKAEAMGRLFEELIAIPVMVIHDHFAALMKKRRPRRTVCRDVSRALRHSRERVCNTGGAEAVFIRGSRRAV